MAERNFLPPCAASGNEKTKSISYLISSISSRESRLVDEVECRMLRLRVVASNLQAY
jgi:hypothetical protein